LLPVGVTISIHEIAGFPEYNEDVRAEGLPEIVARFQNAIAAADGLLFVTPEYNRSIPGVLKNAVDWVSRPPNQPFDGKPVAIMGASRGRLGAIMANHHLRQILTYLNAQIVNGPEVLVGEAASKFDDEGNLIDEQTREFVADQLQKLAQFARKLKG